MFYTFPSSGEKKVFGLNEEEPDLKTQNEQKPAENGRTSKAEPPKELGVIHLANAGIKCSRVIREKHCCNNKKILRDLIFVMQNDM